VHGPLGACYAAVAASSDFGRSTGWRGGVQADPDVLADVSGRLIVRVINDALADLWRIKLDRQAPDAGRRAV
jgi:hypothetical protein